MAAVDFPLTQGDLTPSFAFICINPDGTTADLSVPGTTAALRMRKLNDDDGTGTLLGATVVSGTPGKIRHDWAPGETDAPGTYLADVVVTYPSGKPETFPNGGSQDFPSGYIRIKIKPRP